MKKKNKTKFIVVTGGVLSGLGKGIAAASIGNLLSDRLKVIPVKCDGYLNTDPGTMNPIEHGEVYVLDDGGEVDMDFGHYERFLNVQAKSPWNLTMGKIFKSILDKERKGDYLGKTVQFIPHVTDAIREQFNLIIEEESPDVMLIEVGGTVGDLENQFYLEAIRQLKREVSPQDMIIIHLTYVPIPSGVGEQKSKPTQMSVRDLNERGIEPDIIIGRCSEFLSPAVKEKIASYCNIDPKEVISGVDVECVYENPLIYEKEGVPELLHNKLGLYSPPNLDTWGKWVQVLKNNLSNPRKTVTIALCGKYTALEDSYASIIEALIHCEAHNNIKIKVKWVETSKIENAHDVEQSLKGMDGVIVPGGFGARGIEGKIKLIQYVRENNVPFLGICYGMQLAVVEFARNKCNLPHAHTAEIEETGQKVKDPVIALLPSQKHVTHKGGSMRLGGHDVELKQGTKVFDIFGKKKTVRQRFRHRYEVNPNYVEQIEKEGMIFSGKAPDESIMQILEIPEHKYFVACQFHPELTSNLRKPSPLFHGLIQSILK